MAKGTLASLNKHVLRNKISKYGWTVEKFQREYGCTETQLFDFIGNLFPRGNEAGHLIKVMTSTTTGTGKRPSGATPSKETSKPAEANPVSLAKPVKVVSLETLKETERKLSDLLMRIEAEHKAAWQEHYECRKSIEAIDARISSIRTELAGCIADFDTEIKHARELEERMSTLRERWRSEDAKIVKIRAEIEARSKISVMVCNDGDIICETYEVDDSGYEELYKQMVLDPNMIELGLTMKDVVILAKARRIRENIPDGRVSEFFFDNTRLEEVFKLYATDVPAE